MIKKSLHTLLVVGWTAIALFAQSKTAPSGQIQRRQELATSLPVKYENPKLFKSASSSQQTKAEAWLKDEKTGFVENKGQLKDLNGKQLGQVKFLLNMKGLNVQLRRSGFSYDTYAIKKPTGEKGKVRKGKALLEFHRVDVDLEGANQNARLITDKQVDGVINIFNEYGEFPGIRSFETVTYKDIYPGIDLEFLAKKGTDKPIEYNFIVHPGADASQIKLKYNSGSDIALKNGKIEMQLAHGRLSESIPASWIQQNGKSLAVRYKTESKDLFAFNVPAYDRTKTLVIDPTPSLVWGTYYGNSTATSSNSPAGVDVDEAGNLYVLSTMSGNGFGTAGTYQQTYTTDDENTTHIAKFTSAGARVWATYYASATGAFVAQTPRDIKVDPNGTGVYALSHTSGALAIAPNGSDQTFGGASDMILIKLNMSTGQRLWDTYFGGPSTEVAGDMAIASDGSVYIAGFTSSTSGIATTGSSQPSLSGTNDNTLAKYSSAGVLQWSTYCGGNLTEPQSAGLAIDGNDNVYLSGGTNSTTGIALNTSEGTAHSGGGSDGYVIKFNPSGGRVWGRYIGGTGSDTAPFAAADKTNGFLYVMGSTTSTGLSTPGAFKTGLSGTTDFLLTKMNLNGDRIWSTYYGTAATLENFNNLLVDKQGNIYFAGFTNTPTSDLATPCSLQPSPSTGGSTEAVFTKFNSSGQRIWGTYFGTTGSESGSGIAVDNAGYIYASVGTSNVGGLSTPGAFIPAPTLPVFGFLAKFRESYSASDFTLTTSTVSPATQDACILGIPQVISGNGVAITNADPGYKSPVVYQWQVADAETGPWTDMPGETFKDVQPLASQTNKYYRRLVKVNTSGCDLEVVPGSESPVASVIINSSVAPIANANGPQWYVCGPAGTNTVTLNGSASPAGTYTYEWYAGSATAASGTDATFTPTVTEATTYTLKVTNTATGCSDIDQTTVVPATANAGPAQALCEGTTGVQIGTAPIASPSVTYAWAPAAGLSCTDCAQPIADPAATTTYTLTVTVTRKPGSTGPENCSSTSAVTVTRVAAPNNNLAFGGSDQTICKNGTIQLGTTADASVSSYTWTSGQYLSNSNAAQPNFLAGTAAVNCEMNYTVTAIKSGCAFVDEVKVNVINPAIRFQTETKCGPLWIDQADESNCSAATYAWAVVPEAGGGNGTVLQTRNGGADAYLQSTSGTTRFRRTTTLNGVSCSADVLVQACAGTGCDFEIATLGTQGCPKVFGSAPSFQLTTGLSASEYNFQWSPANMVDNPNAATVTVTSGANTAISVTVTNKFDPSVTCTKSKLVNNPTWALPAFTAADNFVCPGTDITIGQPAVTGFAYAWSPAAGLSSTTIANPIANITATSSFALAITETATGCKSTGNIVVNVSAVQANAGNDRAVCNGATVTLGTPAPAGTNYSYSWQPVNANFTNETSPTDAQPQVLFASTSQTFTLTVTDPLSGCVKTDDVTLRGTVLAGEYAGAAITACPEENVQLGRVAEPFATYLWTKSDGTVATGLSCDNCANPTLTAPDATTSYMVKVSYPGCTTPSEDLVTVTVKTATAISLIDRTICTTTASAIGLGVAGNSAVPAGVASYLWTPSAGLSSTTIANPTTDVKTETTYNLKITYANGCVRSDDVKITPMAIVDAGPDVTICSGQSLTLGSAAMAGATYSWTAAPAGSIESGASSAQPTVRPTVTTIYTVTVTVGSCVTTDQVTVNVNAPVNFAITGNTAICEGGVATVGVYAPAANTSWQWSPLAGVANPNSTSTTIAANATQTYRLTQTNVLTGCSNYKEVIIVVNPNNITASAPDASVCAGVTAALPLSITSGGTNYSYVWAPAAGLSNAYVVNPTVNTNIGKTYTVTITDNTSKCQLVESINVNINAIEACYPPVTLTGNVFHDVNALKDITVNASPAVAIPTGLYATLVDESGNAVPGKTVAINANGSYDMGVVTPGNYSVVLHQSPTGSTTPSLPSTWINTGENLGAGIGNDTETNGILTGITIAGNNVTNANFGVQVPPVTTDAAVASQPNPGGVTTVDISDEFDFSDSDGTVETITFTEFPQNVTTVTINDVVYVAPDAIPGPGQTEFPAIGITVPVEDLSVLIDPIDGDVTASVPFIVTDNGGAQSNESTVTAPFTIPTVSLSGNVFHDANALSDGTVNESATIPAVPAGLYVSLVDANGDIVETVAVGANGAYDFSEVTPGSYSVVLHQTAAGATTPSLTTGWINTGENLGAAAGSDASVNGILPNIVVTTTDVTNANFGVQMPPVTTDEAIASQPNPGGVTTVDISDEFDFTDSDGTVETITFTEFSENVTTVTINGTTYVPTGTTPGAGQTVWPSSGVTVSVTDLSVLIDPTDGDVTASVPFKVTDNGGAESNESTVTAPFTTPLVTLSGNVFHDANALSDGTVNESATTPAVPAGLYVSLVDANGDPIKTVAVGTNGSYDFGDVTPGTYSVVLHQTAAGATTPSLPAGWINTGENLGAASGNDASVNGILPNIVVTTTNVTNANFGVQMPPVAEPKTYVIDQPSADDMITLNGTLVSTGAGTTSPGQLTGSDPEDGTLNGTGKDRTVVITTLADNGELYYDGELVTLSQQIDNYDPALMQIKLTGTGYTSVTFEYAFIDQAGEVSPPVEYTISWERPLPVTLISFSARAVENAAELSWSTASEVNSDRFAIQRSHDGKAWTELAVVAAKGESNAVEKYAYTDRQPNSGSNLYRLKMIDRDGSFAFSSISSVNFDFKFESSIYPNPVSEKLRLQISDWNKVKSIRIDNMRGLKVYESGQVPTGVIDVKTLPSGIYILRITNQDGSVHTHKMIHI